MFIKIIPLNKWHTNIMRLLKGLTAYRPIKCNYLKTEAGAIYEIKRKNGKYRYEREKE